MGIKQRFSDGLVSLTNKLANSRNAHRTNRITACRTDWEELRAILRTGIGSKIVRLKSGLALDDTLQFESTADKDYYESRLQHHVKRAAKFQLAFGRALLVIHEPNADLSQPIGKVSDWSKVRYHVFSGDMVYVQSVNMDLNSPDYFRPQRYSVRGFPIHPSRVVDFTYLEPTEHDAPEYFYGGISEFELIRNEIVADQVVQRAVPAILDKSSTIFYKIKGFKELLQDKREDELLTYITSLENTRSAYGAGVADQEDEIEHVTQALTNLSESDMITLRRLSMVTGLPLSWLVGEAAKGLNSTGEGERQVMMNTITNYQSGFLLENLNRLMMLHGMGQVWFKDNQGETAADRIEYETKAIQNAAILWQMGRDYVKYLQDRDVETPDDFDEFFSEPGDDDIVDPGLGDLSGLLPSFGVDPSGEDSPRMGTPENEEPKDPDASVDPSASLNGAQVTAILEIVSRIRNGEITRTTAQKIIATAFPVSMEEAGALISEVDEGVASGQESEA